MEGKQCQLEYQSCEFNKGTMTDLPACNGILKPTVFLSDKLWGVRTEKGLGFFPLLFSSFCTA